MLWKASGAITSGRPTPFSRAIKFSRAIMFFWWELMEMARKLVLIGFFVIIAPGSILQIAVAFIVCSAYHHMLVQVSPFKNKSDAFLSRASSYGVLMIFFCAIVYKFNALTEFDAIQAKMSIDQREKYIVPITVFTVILFLSVVCSLVLAATMVIKQIRVETHNNFQLRQFLSKEDEKFDKAQRPASSSLVV
jgi:hypothetical protein